MEAEGIDGGADVQQAVVGDDRVAELAQRTVDDVQVRPKLLRRGVRLVPLDDVIPGDGGAGIGHQHAGGKLRVGVQLQAVLDGVLVLAVLAGDTGADDKAAVGNAAVIFFQFINSCIIFI